MRHSHTLEDYKKQAKTLRTQLGPEALTHAAALELVAKQHGFRNWNTLHGSLGNRPTEQSYRPGDRIAGRYLGHRFDGVVKSSARYGPAGHIKLIIRFDEPIDVIAFDSFSSFRQQVTAILDAQGRSPRQTSDGVPHIVLDA